MFLLQNNVGDLKFEIGEQKKVHLFVDMTNISPPSEKNVPLRVLHFLFFGGDFSLPMYMALLGPTRLIILKKSCHLHGFLLLRK